MRSTCGIFAAIILVSSPCAAQSLSRAIPPEDSSSVAAPAVARAPTSVVRAVVARPSRARMSPTVVVSRAAAGPRDPDASSPASRPAVFLNGAAFDADAEVASSAAAPSSPRAVVPAIAPTVAPPRRSFESSAVRCVAMAVFHEARGESVRGQRAVADVVMNRARSGRWGSHACSVVDAPHQFSRRSSWRSPVPGVAAWDRAMDIARDAVSGVVGVSSRLMNFRAARLGAASRSPLRLGSHVFW